MIERMLTSQASHCKNDCGNGCVALSCRNECEIETETFRDWNQVKETASPALHLRLENHRAPKRCDFLLGCHRHSCWYLRSRSRLYPRCWS